MKCERWGERRIQKSVDKVKGNGVEVAGSDKKASANVKRKGK